MNDTSPLVLVIEDELPMRRLLKVTLQKEGYRLLETAAGHEGVTLTRDKHPDLILLDLGLPDVSGLEVTGGIRKLSQVPIIVISARDREDQKVAALDAGADDYVMKPFGASELLARIRAALRRGATADDNVQQTGTFRVGDLDVDFDARRVRVAGKDVHLTPTEYNLLSVLIRSAGRVVTHRQLLKRVWGHSASDQVHYLRVYMKQLRHKIEAVPAHPRYLITEPAIGYRLRVPD